MTALPVPPRRLTRAGRRIMAILLDYLPLRLYPIDMWTPVAHGPATMMAQVAENVGIRGLFDGVLHEAGGVVDRLVPPSPRLSWRVLAAPFKLAAKACRHDPAAWRRDTRLIGFLAKARDLAGRDLTAMAWPDLIQIPRRALDLVRPIGDLRTDCLPGTGLALLCLQLTLTLLRRNRMLPDLIAGTWTRTSDANAALEVLAAAVRANRNVKQAVDELDPHEIARFSHSAPRCASSSPSTATVRPRPRCWSSHRPGRTRQRPYSA